MSPIEAFGFIFSFCSSGFVVSFCSSGFAVSGELIILPIKSKSEKSLFSLSIPSLILSCVMLAFVKKLNHQSNSSNFLGPCFYSSINIYS